LRDVAEGSHSSRIYFRFLLIPNYLVALRDAEILHRDISVGNVMIKFVNGVEKGYLTDWGMSKPGGNLKALTLLLNVR
jgi:serine/threonine protein kinase